jgi:hypothetical protein
MPMPKPKMHGLSTWRVSLMLLPESPEIMPSLLSPLLTPLTPLSPVVLMAQTKTKSELKQSQRNERLPPLMKPPLLLLLPLLLLKNPLTLSLPILPLKTLYL